MSDFLLFLLLLLLMAPDIFLQILAIPLRWAVEARFTVLSADPVMVIALCLLLMVLTWRRTWRALGRLLDAESDKPETPNP